MPERDENSKEQSQQGQAEDAPIEVVVSGVKSVVEVLSNPVPTRRPSYPQYEGLGATTDSAEGPAR